MGMPWMWSAAVLAVLLAPLSVGAQPAGGARIPIRADNDEGGGYVSVRVGDAVRDALAPSNRQLLMLAPSQVAAGGRVFAFGKIPPQLAADAFIAEFLVWEQGTWRRRKVIPRQAGQVGHVSATFIVPELESGSVPTAVFARRDAGEIQVVRSGYVAMPGAAQLRLGYSLDEWDWSDLGPVSVTVAAEFAPGQPNSGRRIELFSDRIVPGKGAAAGAAAGNAPRWFDTTVDLGIVGGQVVRLVFTAEPERVRGKLAPYVVWAAPVVVDAQRARPTPSVVLVSLDGVRARSLGCCGSSRAVSPFMDRLFTEQGMIFDHAVSQSVQTVPSTMTLLTGLYPSVHQVLTPRHALGTDVETLASALSRGGLTTAAFVDGVAMAAELGFGRGFASFVQDTAGSLWDVDGRAARTFDRALEWIANNRDQPYFVWIQTRQALAPHVPPRGYESLFRDTVAASGDGGAVPGLTVRYDREIRYLDDVLSRFVTRLDAVSAPARTLLVVTSAHGEEFLEHGALGSGTQLYDETIRVPLMMRGAGLRPGQRHSGLIGLIDVAPTVLELLDLPVPTSMQGGSVAQALRGGLPYTLPPRFSEAHRSKRRVAGDKTKNWSPPAFAVMESGRKLILTSSASAGGLQAYDTVADPEESNDLLGRGSSVVGADEVADGVADDSLIDDGVAANTDAAASPSGAAPAQAPDWVAPLQERLTNYPTACKQAARPTAGAPALPAGARVKLKAFGYVD